MLNYAFPYDSSLVQARFAVLAAHLDSALSATAPDVRRSHWLAARVARAALRVALPPDDERYLAFQMWQEGAARYTELLAARFAARHFTPSAAFLALPDFVPFDAAAARIESGIRAGCVRHSHATGASPSIRSAPRRRCCWTKRRQGGRKGTWVGR